MVKCPETARKGDTDESFRYMDRSLRFRRGVGGRGRRVGGRECGERRERRREGGGPFRKDQGGKGEGSGRLFRVRSPREGRKTGQEDRRRPWEGRQSVQGDHGKELGPPSRRQRGSREGNEQPGGHHAGRSESGGRCDGKGNPLQGQGFRRGVQVPGDRRGGDRKALVLRFMNTVAFEARCICPGIRVSPALVAALLLFLATGSSPAADFPDGSAPAATDTAADSVSPAADNSWMDQTHSRVERDLFDTVLWFDRFFGDDRMVVTERPESYLRWMNSFRWDEEEHFSLRSTVRASLRLPRLKN